jgi:hypothetical protein
VYLHIKIHFVSWLDCPVVIVPACGRELLPGRVPHDSARAGRSLPRYFGGRAGDGRHRGLIPAVRTGWPLAATRMQCKTQGEKFGRGGVELRMACKSQKRMGPTFFFSVLFYFGLNSNWKFNIISWYLSKGYVYFIDRLAIQL